VSDEVFDQIAAEVLSDKVVAGEALPSERQLAEDLGVSRPSVREALKRLDHAGLVDVRQGDATTVCDYRRTAGLDLLPHFLADGGGDVVKTVRSLLETRLHVGPFVAELAARRGGPSLGPALSEALDDLATQTEPVGRQRASLAFWDVIVDGADSIALRLMYNGLRRAYEPLIEDLSDVLDAAVTNIRAYRKLSAAITEGRPATAAKAATDLLRPATAALFELLPDLEETT
jgi:GntR family transcriptional regulator, transcriptional repressor for pyruvate dehydrogenase complex